MADNNSSHQQGALGWIDKRFPLSKMFKEHMSEYYAPKNLNLWYFFGVFALLVLVIQIVSGIFLVMHYKPDASLNANGISVAFASVEYIMREVPFGSYIRYMHSTGASAFFVVVYLHMFRGLIYGSYRNPRELIWLLGCAIFLCLMAEAFLGYLLPWGQMSFWGAQVIVNLFAAIPFIGETIALTIRGDYVVGDATLNRFFSFHVIALPLVLVGLVAAHIIALHEVGSNNPDGVEIKKTKDAQGRPLDGVPFHPYYSVHDLMGIGVFLMGFATVLFFAPEMGGYFLEANNFIDANPFKTPEHIAPVWYFTPFYSMLRATTSEFLVPLWIFLLGAGLLGMKHANKLMKLAIPAGLVVLAAGFYFFEAKFWGVVVMGGSVIILAFLPWLDQSPIKSIRYRPTFHKYILAVFVIAFIILGYLGVQAPSPVGERVSQFLTLVYFGFFLMMPSWSKVGQFKTEPKRVNFEPH